MLKSVLNLEGVQRLNRNEQKIIKGGRELEPNLPSGSPECNGCEILRFNVCVPVCL
ncbi:hypothetical protein [uncultured Aquimarina sp.]|uniref:hypothetical protein n=1 Tax=uncultured Aquimarina sp. TaxID=575652 RepID=UPI00260EFE0F|nr:hypothetical protein [uncultured Aquimarina sp.]